MFVLQLSSCLFVAGCAAGAEAPRNDDEKLVRATLALLSGRGEPLCVDATTEGRPLSVFRTMATNPPAGVAPPSWFAPAPFSPPTALSSKDLYQGALADGGVHLEQPINTTAAVAPALQKLLDAEAARLAALGTDRSVTISPSWQPGTKARWWLRNRMSFHCSPNYRISNPIAARDLGFVSVTGDHWGTTYAFKRSGTGWVATAQWSNWLY